MSEEVFDELAHELKVNEELADRLRARDREIERLTKLLIENNIETDIE